MAREIYPILVCNDVLAVEIDSGAGGGTQFYRRLHESTYLDAIEDLVATAPADQTTPGAPVHAGSATWAARVRQTYLQLLEVLFAHFFANVQGFDCPEAWLNTYKVRHLQDLARHVAASPWSFDDACPALASPDGVILWLFGVERLGRLDRAAARRELTCIAAALTTLATDFTAPDWAREYAALKHGARAQVTGWALSLAPTDSPDLRVHMPAAAGTHYTYLAPAKGVPRVLRSVSTGWDPQRDLRAAKVASLLLQNLVRARRNEEPQRYALFGSIDLHEVFAQTNVMIRWESGVDPQALTPPPSRAELILAAKKNLKVVAEQDIIPRSDRFFLDE